MPTKTELQAALTTQEQALKEARSREASLRYQLRSAQIATKMILDDLKRNLELPTHYDETGLELAEGFPWGWEAGPPKWWNEKKKGQLLLPWPEAEEQELRCQSPRPKDTGFFPLCSTCYAFGDVREQEEGSE